MARLASEAKGGFYATPPEEMALILQALHAGSFEEGDPFFLFDPCCGEGIALHMIAEQLRSTGAEVITYASEIEESRADKAKQLLDVVLNEGYQDVRTEAKYSLLWLNPPYQENVDGERAELTFLRALTDPRKGVLQKGGYLLFCIPQHVLVDTAGVISGRFRDISVFRFTDATYDVYNQVVLFARYERAASSDQRKAYKALQYLGNGSKELLPTLEEMTPIAIPPSVSKDRPYFRASAMDPQELARDMSNSPLFDELQKRFTPESRVSKLKRPMLPLKPAHMGIAIASGAVGGNMGSHIIAGVTKQRTDVEIMYSEDGRAVGERKTLHFTSVVRSFSNEYGVVDLG